jgi:hypothetical protein
MMTFNSIDGEVGGEKCKKKEFYTPSLDLTSGSGFVAASHHEMFPAFVSLYLLHSFSVFPSLYVLLYVCTV